MFTGNSTKSVCRNCFSHSLSIILGQTIKIHKASPQKRQHSSNDNVENKAIPKLCTTSRGSSKVGSMRSLSLSQDYPPGTPIISLHQGTHPLKITLSSKRYTLICCSPMVSLKRSGIRSLRRPRRLGVWKRETRTCSGKFLKSGRSMVLEFFRPGIQKKINAQLYFCSNLWISVSMGCFFKPCFIALNV